AGLRRRGLSGRPSRAGGLGRTSGRSGAGPRCSPGTGPGSARLGRSLLLLLVIVAVILIVRLQVVTILVNEIPILVHVVAFSVDQVAVRVLEYLGLVRASAIGRSFAVRLRVPRDPFGCPGLGNAVVGLLAGNDPG